MATNAFLDNRIVPQGSLTLGQSGPLIQGAVSLANPSYTSGTTAPLSLTPDGLLRVSATFSGSITIGAVDQGAPNTIANAWPVKITDGTNVVAVSASGAITVLQGTSPWVVSGTVASTQSGTWNIGTVTAVTAITNALPAGTNNIGKVTPTSATTASSPTAATVGTSSASAVASNVNRKGLILVNTSSNIIYLGFGSAAVVNSGVTLSPFGTFEMNEFNFTTAVVNAIASAASSNLAIQEYT